MLKFKLTKSAYDKLPDELKEHYDEAEGGKHYTLDVNGHPSADEDTGALKRALDRVREELKETETERDELDKKLTDIEANRTKGEKDVDRLTKRHRQELADAKAEADTRVDGLKGTIKSLLVDGAANTLAAKISTVPKLMADHIRNRLDVEIGDDGEAKLVVLKDGKASDLTVDKLGEELVANPDFSGIIVGSRARGGGTPSAATPPTGGAEHEKPADLLKASPKELAESLRAAHEARNPAQ